MSSTRRMLIAALLNLGFSICEGILGILFNSSAILADAIHDFGDSIAITISLILERYSQKQADHRFSLGYKNFSLLGALITSMILILGSVLNLSHSLSKLFSPQPLNEEGMFWVGLGAIFINLIAAYLMSKGKNKNETTLSLHILEDLLGWIATTVLALILHVQDWYFLDPLLSLVISAYILYKALPNFLDTLRLLLGAVPKDIKLKDLETNLLELDTVSAVYQLQVWTRDGAEHLGLVHIQANPFYTSKEVKADVRHIFQQQGIDLISLELDESALEHSLHSTTSF